MRKYTIQEVARLHNTSKKALLYYEKIGIFEPEYINERTLYRYYTVNQFSKLKTILALKDLDTPLAEIKEYLENTSSLNSIQFIKGQLQKVAHRKQQLLEIEERLSERLEVYEKAHGVTPEALHIVTYKRVGKRQVCYFPCKDRPEVEEVLLTYRKIIEYLKSHNVGLSRHYGDIYLQEGFSGDILSHVGVFSLVKNSDSLPEHIRLLPAGEYACMYKQGGYPDKKAVEFFLEEIRKNGFVPDGDILSFALLDYGDTRDIKTMLYEFQLKVKKFTI